MTTPLLVALVLKKYLIVGTLGIGVSFLLLLKKLTGNNMQYISVTDYLMGRVKFEDLSDDLKGHVNTIVPKANELLSHFGQFRKCNSGYRSPDDQRRINPKAMHSNHLICLAIDLEDNDGALNKFCKDNPKLLESLELYCEERQGNWQHIQAISPKSGHRWFIP